MFDLSSVTGHSGHSGQSGQSGHSGQSGQSELSQNKTFFSFVWRETRRSNLLIFVIFSFVIYSRRGQLASG